MIHPFDPQIIDQENCAPILSKPYRGPNFDFFPTFNFDGLQPQSPPLRFRLYSTFFKDSNCYCSELTGLVHAALLELAKPL